MRDLALALLCLAALAGTAEAHATLEKATPEVGSTVQAPPKEVAITFSENVEPAFSNIQVTDAAGKRVDTGKAHPAADNRQVLIADLQPLGPGTYTVAWRAVSVDTHKTQGSFSFTVAP